MNRSSPGFRQIFRDCLDLFELQAQLISVDAQAAKAKFQRAIACSVAGLAIAASTLTVAMITAALLISEFATLSLGVSMLIISGIGAAIIVTLLGIAVLSLKSAASFMEETKSELAENMRWLKATLVNPGESPRDQLRSESYPVAGNHGAPRWTDDPTYQPPSQFETTLPNR